MSENEKNLEKEFRIVDHNEKKEVPYLVLGNLTVRYNFSSGSYFISSENKNPSNTPKEGLVKMVEDLILIASSKEKKNDEANGEVIRIFVEEDNWIPIAKDLVEKYRKA
jgi:hypothetical protein